MSLSRRIGPNRILGGVKAKDYRDRISTPSIAKRCHSTVKKQRSPPGCPSLPVMVLSHKYAKILVPIHKSESELRIEDSTGAQEAKRRLFRIIRRQFAAHVSRSRLHRRVVKTPSRSLYLSMRSLRRDEACQWVSVHSRFTVMHVLILSSTH